MNSSFLFYTGSKYNLGLQPFILLTILETINLGIKCYHLISIQRPNKLQLKPKLLASHNEEKSIYPQYRVNNISIKRNIFNTCLKLPFTKFAHTSPISSGINQSLMAFCMLFSLKSPHIFLSDTNQNCAFRSHTSQKQDNSLLLKKRNKRFFAE